MIMAIQLLGDKRKARARIEKELWIMKYCTIAYAEIIEASWLAYGRRVNNRRKAMIGIFMVPGQRKQEEVGDFAGNYLENTFA